MCVRTGYCMLSGRDNRFPPDSVPILECSRTFGRHASSSWHHDPGDPWSDTCNRASWWFPPGVWLFFCRRACYRRVCDVSFAVVHVTAGCVTFLLPSCMLPPGVWRFFCRRACYRRVCDFYFAVVRITAERITPFAVVRQLRVRGLSFPHRHSSHRQCHRRRGWSRPVSFRSRQHLSVLVAVARAVCTVAWAQPHRP
jgi:hypothetical protein